MRVFPGVVFKPSCQVAARGEVENTSPRHRVCWDGSGHLWRRRQRVRRRGRARCRRAHGLISRQRCRRNGRLRGGSQRRLPPVFCPPAACVDGGRSRCSRPIPLPRVRNIPTCTILKVEAKVRIFMLCSAFIVVHSRRSGMDHTVLPANYNIPAFTS